MGKEISPAAIVIVAIAIIVLLVVAGSLTLPAFRVLPSHGPESSAEGGSQPPAAVPSPPAAPAPEPTPPTPN